MAIVQFEIDEIPEGRGLSFKKGVSSALLDEDFSANLPDGHKHSYERGLNIGIQLKAEIAKLVKKSSK